MSYESDDKMVSHPDHYNSGKFEVIDIIEEFTKDLSGIEAVDTGNAIKYVLRWHKKNGVQDVKKAIWYLTHLAEHLEEKENPSKPHSVIIHKLSNGHYAIEDIKDDEEIDEEVHLCGTCEWQYSSVMCPRAKDIMSGASDTCFNEAIACEKWKPKESGAPIFVPCTDETIAKDFIDDVSKVEDQLDKEEPELSVECHTNAAGVTVPDSQPWSSSVDEHTCHSCGYYLRKHDLEPCKSCNWYSNWEPKKNKEEDK